MKRRIKGMVVALAVVLMFAFAAPAFAETVYYNGSAVSWDHGRTAAVYSFSDVQTSGYEHSATANTTFSGWKSPGVQAHAQQLVGVTAATAYWNCR
jgi:hypothetical protein